MRSMFVCMCILKYVALQCSEGCDLTCKGVCSYIVCVNQCANAFIRSLETVSRLIEWYVFCIEKLF